MSFIDSYKRLEKLCNEIYGDIHGVKVYIDEMKNNPMGARYVQGWDEDLKKLKHYKWVRNKIWHDPNCNEDNMCEPGDVEWLDKFRSRIMSAADPLALYRKAQSPRITQKTKQTYSPEPTSYTYPKHKNTSSKPAGCLTYVMGVLLVVAVVVLIVATI